MSIRAQMPMTWQDQDAKSGEWFQMLAVNDRSQLSAAAFFSTSRLVWLVVGMRDYPRRAWIYIPPSLEANCTHYAAVPTA